MEGTLCLPGTHSKWARIEAGTVTGFSTAMTGEVYALLAKRSTLAHFIASTQGTVADVPAFSKAVRDAIEAPESALNLLFSVRATPLLMGRATAEEMPARLSGLLIGLEIAGMKKLAGDHVALISSDVLAQNYSRALSVAEIGFELCNAEEMARSGLYHAARSLWPDRLQGEVSSR